MQMLTSTGLSNHPHCSIAQCGWLRENPCKRTLDPGQSSYSQLCPPGESITRVFGSRALVPTVLPCNEEYTYTIQYIEAGHTKECRAMPEQFIRPGTATWWVEPKDAEDGARPGPIHLFVL